MDIQPLERLGTLNQPELAQLSSRDPGTRRSGPDRLVSIINFLASHVLEAPFHFFNHVV